MQESQYKNLLVTVEHAGTGKMGGIGSYNVQMGKMTNSQLVLLFDDTIEASPADNIILCHEYVAAKLPDMVQWYKKHHDLRGYVIVQAVQSLLREHPGIRNIDIEEYGGIGARVAEACRAGLFGPAVRVRTTCHGGQIQLERATGTWSGVNEYALRTLERSSVENADEVRFPSSYLHRLYQTAGVRFDNTKAYALGLPHDLGFGAEPPKTPYTTIKNIVFVGRMNRLKGYEVFTDTVDYLVEKAGFGSQIERVVAIGKEEGVMRDKTEHLHNLARKHKFSFEQTLMTLPQVLDFEKVHAKDSLFVLPYMSDNYSVALLELIEVAAPVICLDTGGNSELVASDRWYGRLAANQQELFKIAQRYMDMSNEQRQDECGALYQDFVRQQKHLNQQNAKRFTSFETVALAAAPKVHTIALNIEPSATGVSINPHTAEVYKDGKSVTVEALRKQLHDAPVFVATSTIGLHDLPAAATACAEVYRRTNQKVAITFGLSAPTQAQLSYYIDLELFAIDPIGSVLRNVCVPAGMLLDYVEQYKHALAGKARRSPGYFMIGLTYYLLAREVPVMPVPMLLEVESCKVPDVTYDEALFADLAQFAPSPNWSRYRHMAALRHEMCDEYNLGRYPGPTYIKRYVEAVMHVGQHNSAASKILKMGVRAQHGLLKKIVQVKRKLL